MSSLKHSDSLLFSSTLVYSVDGLDAYSKQFPKISSLRQSPPLELLNDKSSCSAWVSFVISSSTQFPNMSVESAHSPSVSIQLPKTSTMPLQS